MNEHELGTPETSPEPAEIFTRLSALGQDESLRMLFLREVAAPMQQLLAEANESPARQEMIEVLRSWHTAADLYAGKLGPEHADTTIAVVNSRAVLETMPTTHPTNLPSGRPNLYTV